MYIDSNNYVECCGCKACVDICPRKCISIKEDSEGFVYPVLDKEKCISCGLCYRVCPQNCTIPKSSEVAVVKVGIHRSSEQIKKSASGGAFAAICEQLLSDEYIVFGVKFDGNFKVLHDDATTESECECFKKSKYVLSDTNGSYEKIAGYLQEGRKVLFSGTPCQGAALIQFLTIKRIDRTNLVVVDLICHGAPNQTIFDSYRTELEKKYSRKLLKYNFKNKKAIKGVVNSRTAQYELDNAKEYLVTPKQDPFLQGYYSRLFYRPSCGSCRFAQPDRLSDITLGDAWGIEKTLSHWKSSEGVSLIIANTAKGKSITEKLNDNMILKISSIQWAIENNQQISFPTQMHPKRELFFTLWNRDRTCFSKAVKRALKRSFFARVMNRIRYILKR